MMRVGKKEIAVDWVTEWVLLRPQVATRYTSAVPL